ncbi:hypothetical protein [Modestobacter lacusdianchii]
MAIRLAPGENAERPAVFSVPHHHRDGSMVVVQLSAVDRGELAELLTEAWRPRVPARLRARPSTRPPADEPPPQLRR